LIRLALHNPAGVGEWRARPRAPDTLVEATFHAIADAGSIPAVSTATDSSPRQPPGASSLRGPYFQRPCCFVRNFAGRARSRREKRTVTVVSVVVVALEVVAPWAPGEVRPLLDHDGGGPQHLRRQFALPAQRPLLVLHRGEQGGTSSRRFVSRMCSASVEPCRRAADCRLRFALVFLLFWLRDFATSRLWPTVRR
jgi:hypothetical protein